MKYKKDLELFTSKNLMSMSNHSEKENSHVESKKEKGKWDTRGIKEM